MLCYDKNNQQILENKQENNKPLNMAGSALSPQVILEFVYVFLLQT